MAKVRGESRPHGVRRREQIITAAIELFGEVGYRAAGLRDIAARAGITHPGLLYHFGSKEELLAAVLKYRDLEQEGMLSAVHGEPHLVIRAIYQLVESNARQSKIVEMFTMLAAESTDSAHPAHDYFELRYGMLRDRYTGLASVLADAGMLRPGITPRVVATNMIALLDGLQIQWLHDPEAVDMVAQVDCFIRAILLPHHLNMSEPAALAG